MSNNCFSPSGSYSLLNLAMPNQRSHQDQRSLGDIVPRRQQATNTREQRMQQLHRIIDEALALIDEDMDDLFSSEDEESSTSGPKQS
eukprot:scaffold1522_cov166-Amphora_coffeaeformis.AAC.2